MTIDVNADFARLKGEQIAGAQQAVQDSRQRIADYDAGLTQAALDRRLAEDIVAGKIEMISPNSYRMLQGFDTGEVFSVVRAARPEEVPMVSFETGLDLDENGQASLYLKDTAFWHGLGEVIPGGTSDIEEVLRIARIPEIGITDLMSLVPGVAPYRSIMGTAGGQLARVEDKRLTYRKDTMAPLGVVGNVYRVIQPATSFAFLQELAGAGDAIFASAGPMRGGRKVFVTMELPQDVVIDAAGVEDHIKMYLALVDSFDGTSQFTAMMTPWRIGCGNTERFAFEDALTKWRTRHTTNALARIEEARRTLGLSLKYIEAFKAEEEKLAQTEIKIREFEALMAELWPEAPDTELTPRQRKTVDKRKDAQHALWGTYSRELGETAYAAERVVTDYIGNVAPKRALGGSMAAARATAILEDADEKTRNTAHKQLMTLTNR